MKIPCALLIGCARMKNVAVPGYNMRSTEINGFLGLLQLERLDYNIEQRSKNLNIWIEHLDSNKYFTDSVGGQGCFIPPTIRFNSLCESDVGSSSLCFSWMFIPPSHLCRCDLLTFVFRRGQCYLELLCLQ